MVGGLGGKLTWSNALLEIGDVGHVVGVLGCPMGGRWRSGAGCIRLGLLDMKHDMIYLL